MLAECAREADQGMEDYLTVDDKDGAQAVSSSASPWDEEISILNVTTTTFGARERGWVGRTSMIRTVKSDGVYSKPWRHQSHEI